MVFRGRHVYCECDNEVLVFSVIIPLFKFADALVLPQWDAERVSKLGFTRQNHSNFGFCLIGKIDSKILGTPLKINMEYNHGGLEDQFSF